jgi:hypothetical protein
MCSTPESTAFPPTGSSVFSTVHLLPFSSFGHRYHRTGAIEVCPYGGAFGRRLARDPVELGEVRAQCRRLLDLPGTAVPSFDQGGDVGLTREAVSIPDGRAGRSRRARDADEIAVSGRGGLHAPRRPVPMLDMGAVHDRPSRTVSTPPDGVGGDTMRQFALLHTSANGEVPELSA